MAKEKPYEEDRKEHLVMLQSEYEKSERKRREHAYLVAALPICMTRYVETQKAVEKAHEVVKAMMAMEGA